MAMSKRKNKLLAGPLKRRLCPACMKPCLELYAGWLTGNYICRKCGYLGPLAVEEEAKKRKKGKKKP